ncbi:MAG: hypothetical protein HY220_04200 [Candidatus Sungbacteria bacterium]|uniref:Uncharacterized protein n=1 Tax=Candidatus Sungiibacteriota bacterium TaxID=2750080 RepID=A0A9D6QZ07_9BACT|nr:hypothetical protein [Candidatus Sungbacteria bacterium]
MPSKILGTLTSEGYIVPPASSLLRIWRHQLRALESIEDEILYEIAGEPGALKILHQKGKARDLLWALDKLWRKRGSSAIDPIIERIARTRQFLLDHGFKADDLGTQFSLLAGTPADPATHRIGSFDDGWTGRP